ncbi:MAG: molybdopterin dinucleotide binding domain-containing protein [Myxococcales bacterium]
MVPRSRSASIFASASSSPFRSPKAEYPLWLSTGRLVYHWHTRTKTGRVRALQQAAAEPFVQLSAEDAKRLGIGPGHESCPRKVRHALFAGPGRAAASGSCATCSILGAGAVHPRRLEPLGAGRQGAARPRDGDAIATLGAKTDRQIAWVRTVIAATAAQALSVPPNPLAELVASRPKSPGSPPRRAIRKARIEPLLRLLIPASPPEP